MPVVASFSILADMVKAVGGDRVNVHTLVEIGADPHVYRPTSRDLRRVARARLVVMNGAGFEGWMRRLVSAAGASAEVLVATDGLALRERVDVPPHHDGHAHEKKAERAPGEVAGGSTSVSRGPHRAGEFDPHAWHDPRLGAGYVRNITAGLSRVDPGGAAHYRQRGESFVAAIDARFERLRRAVGTVRTDRRVVLAPHDGFAYMNEAYGLSILPLAVTSGHQSPSAGRLAHLLRELRHGEVLALFSERATASRFVTQLARESGLTIAGRLFADSLSKPGGPAPTYLDLLEHNVTTILGALGPGGSGG